MRYKIFSSRFFIVIFTIGIIINFYSPIRAWSDCQQLDDGSWECDGKDVTQSGIVYDFKVYINDMWPDSDWAVWKYNSNYYWRQLCECSGSNSHPPRQITNGGNPTDFRMYGEGGHTSYRAVWKTDTGYYYMWLNECDGKHYPIQITQTGNIDDFRMYWDESFNQLHWAVWKYNNNYYWRYLYECSGSDFHYPKQITKGGNPADFKIYFATGIVPKNWMAVWKTDSGYYYMWLNECDGQHNPTQITKTSNVYDFGVYYDTFQVNWAKWKSNGDNYWIYLYKCPGNPERSTSTPSGGDFASQPETPPGPELSPDHRLTPNPSIPPQPGPGEGGDGVRVTVCGDMVEGSVRNYTFNDGNNKNRYEFTTSISGRHTVEVSHVNFSPFFMADFHIFIYGPNSTEIAPYILLGDEDISIAHSPKWIAANLQANATYWVDVMWFTPDHRDDSVPYTIRIYTNECSANPSVPIPPTGVTATNGTYTDKVRVTWSASSGATGYEVWHATSSSSLSASKIGDVTSTNYDDIGASPGTTYYYWVKAKNSAGTSEFSSPCAGYRNEKVQNISENQGLADSAWPCRGNDLRNTGQSPFIGAQTNNLKWWYQTDDMIQSSPAIGVDGTIYFGSNDGKVYALYPDGKIKWSYQTSAGVNSSPAISSFGTIYIGNKDGNLYALNQDGSLNWRYQADGEVWSSPAVVIVKDATIYFGSWNCKVYALNSDGSLKWMYQTGGSVWSSPAIGADGTIYVGSDNGKLYALKPNGELQWSYQTNGCVEASPAIGADGTIYAGSEDGKLYALKPDGTLKWSYQTGSYGIVSPPAISTDGTIYIGSCVDKVSYTPQDGKIYALNPDGSLKWSYPTGNGIWPSFAIGADGVIYSGTNDDGNIYALNSNGTLKWSYHIGAGGPLGAGGPSSPAIGADGTVYVGNFDGKIYAFGSPVLSAPTGVSATDGTYTDKVRVTWSASSGATSYEVYRSTSYDSSTATKIGSSTYNSYDDTMVTRSATYYYYYWVKAKNSAGLSSFSSPPAIGYPLAILLPPTGVSASDGNYKDKVYITWNSDSDAWTVPGYYQANPINYYIYRATSSTGSKTKLAETSTKNYSDISATSGTKYYYWIKAFVLNHAESEYSEPDIGYKDNTTKQGQNNQSDLYGSSFGGGLYGSSFGGGLYGSSFGGGLYGSSFGGGLYGSSFGGGLYGSSFGGGLYGSSFGGGLYGSSFGGSLYGGSFY